MTTGETGPRDAPPGAIEHATYISTNKILAFDLSGDNDGADDGTPPGVRHAPLGIETPATSPPSFYTAGTTPRVVTIDGDVTLPTVHQRGFVSCLSGLGLSLVVYSSTRGYGTVARFSLGFTFPVTF